MIIHIPTFKEFKQFLKANPPPDKRNFTFATGPFSEKQWLEPRADRLETGEEAFLKLACLYMCVQIRAEALASIRLKLMRKQKEGEAEEVPDHWLSILLENVNQFESAYDLKIKTSAYLDLTGNCFWLFDNYIGKQPTEIWIPRPSQVKIIPDRKNFISHYEYLSQGYDKSQAKRYEIDQVLHFKTFNSIDPWYGASPLLSGSTELATDWYASQYQINFFKNGAMPTKIFQVEGLGSVENMKEWLEKWYLSYGGVKQAHKTAFVNENVKELSSGPTMHDMEFNVLRKFSREYILGLYRVPPMLAGVFEYANYANAREQRKSFWLDGMAPRENQMLSVLDQILLLRFEKPEAGFFWEWDLSNVDALQETSEERIRNAVNLWNSGLAKRNEIRAMVNLSAVDDLEDTYKPAPSSLFSSTDMDNLNKDDMRKLLEAPAFNRVKQLVGVEANGKNGMELKIGDTSWKLNSSPDSFMTKEEYADILWKRFDRRLSQQEFLFEKDMQNFFAGQIKRILANFDEAYPPENKMIPIKFKQASGQTLEIIFKRAIEDEKIKKAILRRFELIVNFAGNVASEDFEAMIDMDLTNPRIKGFFQQKEFLATIINDTTSEQIRLRVERAIEQGMTTKELRDDIVNLFDEISEGRAMTIARTETGGAYNFGTLEAWKQSGVVAKKQWFSARDEKVRDSHKALDGQIVPIDSLFSNGLMYPLDQTAGKPEEVINCRCDMKSLSGKE